MKKAIIVTAEIRLRSNCKEATEECDHEMEYFDPNTTLNDLFIWTICLEKERDGYIVALHVREDDLTLLERIREERKKEQ